MKIELGQKVESLVTGFSGFVTARYEYLNGCCRYEVQPKIDDAGNHVSSKCFDEQELKALDEKIIIVPTETGGPQSVVPPTRY